MWRGVKSVMQFTLAYLRLIEVCTVLYISVENKDDWFWFADGYFFLKKGSCSEFVSCHEDFIALKPPSLSYEDAASIPLAAMTALQALRKYEGDLAGKTVFVPAGCMLPSFFFFMMLILMQLYVVSGTGSFACQIAKHVFHADKVITTVSTSKVPKVKELLGEGTVDESKCLSLITL